MREQREETLKGLDFGCAIGAPLVLGKLLGLDVIGVDVPYFDDRGSKSCYLDVQNQLAVSGYHVHIFDTGQFPWTQFEDNTFDFVLTYMSFDKDFTKTHNGENHRDPRIKEFLRILKPGGWWIVFPKRHYDLIVKNHNVEKSSKSIVILDAEKDLEESE